MTKTGPVLRHWCRESRMRGRGIVLDSTGHISLTTAGRLRSDSSWSYEHFELWPCMMTRWHHWRRHHKCMACSSFFAVCLTDFPTEFWPRTKDHRISQKKVYQIRAYGFGMQFFVESSLMAVGVRAHYIIEYKVQWKPFWLATQQYAQNDWLRGNETCTILGRHFGRVSVPVHMRDKYKILMADREFAVVSGHTRRLFPRVHFQFWPQRRHYTGILFLPFKLPRGRSRQKGKSQNAKRQFLLYFWDDLKSRKNPVPNLKLRRASLVCMAINRRHRRSVKGHSVLCKTFLYVLTHEGNFMRANQVCVWFTAVICVRNGFFLIIIWQSGVSLNKCHSHHAQWRLKHFFLEG